MKTPYASAGAPEPLGATWDGRGTNFALYSEGATGVLLCLFDADGVETRVPVRRKTAFVWHAYVEGVTPGTAYGYRVDGPWNPEKGLRFNPANVLLDPYARALSDTEHWESGAYSYDRASPDKDLTRATSDQRGAPLGLVIDPTFDWGDDAAPNTYRPTYAVPISESPASPSFATYATLASPRWSSFRFKVSPTTKLSKREI